MEHRFQETIDMYKSGMTERDVAEELGISQTAVHYRLAEADVDTSRGKYPKLQDEDWLREQLIERERTLKDIGGELGCAAGSVKYWARKLGIRE